MLDIKTDDPLIYRINYTLVALPGRRQKGSYGYLLVSAVESLNLEGDKLYLLCRLWLTDELLPPRYGSKSYKNDCPLRQPNPPPPVFIRRGNSFSMTLLGFYRNWFRGKNRWNDHCNGIAHANSWCQSYYLLVPCVVPCDAENSPSSSPKPTIQLSFRDLW